ncbi:alpha-1-antitrypsin-like [Dendrobates tinctorius]|uniref:alpha-1-antitrypsin-like n=1 Tax=Dendrobates tinctorius TaxID=92724 RepID=UPI003CC949F2
MMVFLFFGSALLFPILFAADDKNSYGKIAELHHVDQDVISAPVSLIYFRAKFDNLRSEEGYFHINEKTTVKVLFMRRTGMYKVAFTDEATVVSIPYKADAEVFFIWPAEGKLSKIEENINEEKIQRWKKSMDICYVDLYLPNLQEILLNALLADISALPSPLTPDRSKTSRTVRKAKMTDSEVSPPIEIIIAPLPVIVIIPGIFK